MRIRIQLFTLMRIRIQNLASKLRLKPLNADVDPGYQNDADLCGSGSTTLATTPLDWCAAPTSFPFFFLEKPVERCRSLSQLPGACALEVHRHSLRRLDAEFTATSSRRPRLLLRVLAKSKTRTKINQNSSWFVLSSALIIIVLYESFFSILSFVCKVKTTGPTFIDVFKCTDFFTPAYDIKKMVW